MTAVADQVRLHDVSGLIKEVIGKAFVGRIDVSTTLDGALGLDANEKLELVCRLEVHYSITVPREISSRWNTVGDIVDYLKTAY